MENRNYEIKYINNNVEVTNFGGLESFSLKETLECGQCFRFLPTEDDLNTYTGVIKNMFLKISQNEDKLVFYNIKKEDFEYIFYEYFDFSQDYKKIKDILKKDSTLKTMISYAPGIHILKQDLWETLISFIISQNNNIKRIQGIIKRLCESFGEPLIGNEGEFSFPSVKVMSALDVSDLEPLRAGFRAKYIIDAAQKVNNKEVDIKKIYDMDYDEAKKHLQLIKGVGPKVSDCVLLFGTYKINAFPMDVWMKRAMEEYFKNGLPEEAKKYGGIAQQYIFHYVRTKNK